MLNRKVISTLKDLDSHLLRCVICLLDVLNFTKAPSHNPSDNSLVPSLSNMLAQCAVVFTSTLDVFSLILAIEERQKTLVTVNTHLLICDPMSILQPLSTYREALIQAITKAQSDVDFLVSQIKQVRFSDKANICSNMTPILLIAKRRFYDSQLAHTRGRKRSWYSFYSPCCVDQNSDSYNVPIESLMCIQCVLTRLLDHSEGVLDRRYFASQHWLWVTSESESGVTFLEGIRPLFLSRRRRAQRLRLLKGLFPYHQEVDNLGDFAVQFPRASPPLSPLQLAFGPQHNQQSFWTQLLLLAVKIPPPCTRRTSKPSDHWRPCSCKQQRKFAAASRRMKSDLQADDQKITTEAVNLRNAKNHSNKPLPKTNEIYRGTFQGDWSF